MPFRKLETNEETIEPQKQGGYLKGVGKTVVETAVESSGLGEKLIKGIGRAVTPKEYEEKLGFEKTDETSAEKLVPEKYRTPVGTKEKAGFIAGEIGQFMIPVPGTKIKNAAKAVSWGKKLYNLGIRSFNDAIEFAGKTALQTGDPGEVKKAGIIGAVASPTIGVISAGVKKLAPVVGEVMSGILASMIGKEPEHIKYAFKNPVAVAKKISEGVIPLEVREKIVIQVKNQRKKLSEMFEGELSKLEKLVPKFKPARDVTGQFSNIKTKMTETINNIQKGLPGIIRKYSVAVEEKGTLLNFDKLNSNIVKPAERKQLQRVFDTIKQQTDFSVKGVQRVASKIGKLAKFETSTGDVSSAIIGEFYTTYKNAIKNVYPELSKLRNVYDIQKTIISGVDDIVKSVKDNKANPTAVTSAARKLSNLFKEDSEAYVEAVKRLEKQTGTDVMAELAASEFKNYWSRSVASPLFQASFLAGGFLYNPWILSALVLFSPRFIGRLTTSLGKMYNIGKQIAPKTGELAPKAIPPLTR